MLRLEFLNSPAALSRREQSQYDEDYPQGRSKAKEEQIKSMDGQNQNSSWGCS